MILFPIMMLCTQVNYDVCVAIEGTRLSSEISHTRTDLTA